MLKGPSPRPGPTKLARALARAWGLLDHRRKDYCATLEVFSLNAIYLYFVMCWPKFLKLQFSNFNALMRRKIPGQNQRTGLAVNLQFLGALSTHFVTTGTFEQQRLATPIRPVECMPSPYWAHPLD